MLDGATQRRHAEGIEQLPDPFGFEAGSRQAGGRAGREEGDDADVGRERAPCPARESVERRAECQERRDDQHAQTERVRCKPEGPHPCRIEPGHDGACRQGSGAHQVRERADHHRSREPTGQVIDPRDRSRKEELGGPPIEVPHGCAGDERGHQEENEEDPLDQLLEDHRGSVEVEPADSAPGPSPVPAMNSSALSTNVTR